jgi:hypothetical protein
MTTGEIERLVPLDRWIWENYRTRSIWQSGSPHLREPAGMGRWLRRHEIRLTDSGAVLRLGNAWRLIEPTFKTVLFEILAEERERAQNSNKKGKSK